MSDNNITVKEFILGAIKEGIEEAPYYFMESLENKLRLEMKITESGSSYDYLQNLINEQVELDELESESED
jgi:hypothetical protein